THVPQSLDVGACARVGAHVVVTRGMIEHQNVFGDWRTRQCAFARWRGKSRLQSADRGKIERGIAPLHKLHRLETVRFERLDQFGFERRTASAGAKSAVAHGASGASGDLGQFGRTKFAELVAVEFTIGRESDVVNVEI